MLQRIKDGTRIEPGDPVSTRNHGHGTLKHIQLGTRKAPGLVAVVKVVYADGEAHLHEMPLADAGLRMNYGGAMD